MNTSDKKNIAHLIRDYQRQQKLSFYADFEFENLKNFIFQEIYPDSKTFEKFSKRTSSFKKVLSYGINNAIDKVFCRSHKIPGVKETIDKILPVISFYIYNKELEDEMIEYLSCFKVEKVEDDSYLEAYTAIDGFQTKRIQELNYAISIIRQLKNILDNPLLARTLKITGSAIKHAFYYIPFICDSANYAIGLLNNGLDAVKKDKELLRDKLGKEDVEREFDDLFQKYVFLIYQRELEFISKAIQWKENNGKKRNNEHKRNNIPNTSIHTD
ncbi:hypothetical protein DRJ17_00545 [Candidatus Woesearchaeota archaeon]|nr:MAG: hypothetical protein DRJ17_00545 [Candidatus Woesearchaeota archaeon]